jgi:hypothetical protein
MLRAIPNYQYYEVQKHCDFYFRVLRKINQSWRCNRCQKKYPYREDLPSIELGLNLELWVQMNPRTPAVFSPNPQVIRLCGGCLADTVLDGAAMVKGVTP